MQLPVFLSDILNLTAALTAQKKEEEEEEEKKY